jgi:Tfp pilus assembly protein FimT
MTNRRPQELGFSLVEAMVVVGIMMTLAAFAMLQSFGSMENYRANAAMDIAISQLRVARQLAISQRRTVTISFNIAAQPQTMTYQLVPNAGDTVIPKAVTVPIPPQVSFAQVANEPDTPMGFGTCGGSTASGSGICIGGVAGGPPVMEFTSVGQFTDVSGVTTENGTVFLAIPGQVPTARAVTILGSTGRVRSYTWIGGSGPAAWTE